MLMCSDKCNMFSAHPKLLLGDILVATQARFSRGCASSQDCTDYLFFSCENLTVNQTFLVSADDSGETACHKSCVFDNRIALTLAWLTFLVSELSAWKSLDICIQYFSRESP